MTLLHHPVTDHQIQTNDASVDFWKAAGYVLVEEPKAPAKKAASKKSSSTKK